MKYFVYIVFISIVLTNCSDTQNYEIVEIDGIKTYKNKATPSNKDFKIKLTKIFEIDDLKENQDSLSLLYQPVDITEDMEGNLYILDVGLSKVLKFNKKGKFILSFGGKGQGPGEFTRPLFIHSSNKEITVADFNMLNIYDLNGKFIEKKINQRYEEKKQ